MKKKEKALEIIRLLEKEYPVAKCSLESTNPLELLIATRLSAQCTDARVNIVIKELFAKYKTAEDFAAADLGDIERIVHPCGLYKTKARDIILMSQALLQNYNGIVPDTIEELVKLPGVGRKTANLIVGEVYGKPCIVVDTHCIRLSNRLGLVKTEDPKKAEDDLRKLIPPDKSREFCHRLVSHGRAVCKARKPECSGCCLKDYCSYVKTSENDS